MKNKSKILVILVVAITVIALFSISVFAVTEDEVTAQIANSSKETVTGNVFIWFLCAIAFLKISQKIDSFMSSLGINVGHTGGNMLAEALVATRGIAEGKQFLGGGYRGRGGGSSGGSSSHSSSSNSTATNGFASSASFFSGGLAGIASRQFNKSAISAATNQGGNVVTNKVFQKSLSNGGDFANNVISTVAHGDIRQTGAITGNTANQAITSYLGLTNEVNAPTFSNVEIGGGRMTGTENTPANPQGIQFAMYNTEQYLQPEKGKFDTIVTKDGAKWYRQYASETMEKSPYKAPDGKIEYNETLVPKLPPMPKRKDRA